MTYEFKGYNDLKFNLVDHLGSMYKVGDKVTLDGEECTITSISAPHKPSSTGRVGVDNQREYYAGVFDLAFVIENK